jgi:predicted permease
LDTILTYGGLGKMSKKYATICSIVGTTGLAWGAMNFELGGIDSPGFAIAVSLSIVLGAVLFSYGGYGLLKRNKEKTKTIVKKGGKPMAKTKKETPKENLSVDLMKREKELETRRKELESLLAEVSKEEKAVEKRLIEKGWVQKDGSWGIE